MGYFQNKDIRLFVVVLCISFFLQGCASVPYKYGRNLETATTLKLKTDEPQVERGRDDGFFRLLDFLGHRIISLPSKLILWNWKVDNHNISQETEGKIKEFLNDNNLRNVKVRLNQYAPWGEWNRLRYNKDMHVFWRYSFGTITVLMYTLLPGRIFGGDNYNPFTNTINLYSDHKGIALHEAAHAKDLSRRHFKGLYSAARILPLVPLYQEAVATGDAIGYDKDNNNLEDEKEDYKILYPAYATYIAGEGLNWVHLPFGQGYLITLTVAIPGHIIGRVKANSVNDGI